MYTLNVTHLKQFYTSPLGEMVGAHLRYKIASMWPDAQNDITLAIGFPNILWQPTNLPKNLLVAMPAEHGALCWPADKNKVFAMHDAALPLGDNTVNRVILIHALEHSAHISSFMQEIGRVLTPQGRAMIIVPNRIGLWARSSHTPFGFGRPFSLTQIKSVIEESQLTFLRSFSMMFVPPTNKRLWLKSAGAIELIGRLFLPMFGGLHVIETEKQLYAPILQPVRVNPAKLVPAPVSVPAASRSYKDY